MNNSYEKEILEVFVDDIIPNRFQPRLTFDEKSLEDLAISIKEHGIIQPLVVRKIADKYEIIAGERRYKAAQMAGLKKVPAIVMDLDDKESAEVAVIENTQRRDLSSLEEAESYKKLLDKGYLTQEQLANRMGKNQATISNKLRLLNLPFEVKKALLENQISERHARSLLSLNNEVEQIKFLNDIVNNKLTVKQTDDKIKEQLNASSFSNNNTELPPFNFNSSFTASEPVQENPIPEVNTFSNNNTKLPPFNFNSSFTASEPVQENSIPEVNTFSNNNTELPPFNFSPDVPIVEQAKEVKPFMEETNGIDFIKPEPIVNYDINQIINNSTDINPIEETKNIDEIIGIKTSEEISKPEEKVSKNKFLIDFEEVPKEEMTDQPKTYTDELVQEYRQQTAVGEVKTAASTNELDLDGAIKSVRETINGLKNSNIEVETEEFDFESLYQIIIKINKKKN